MHTLLQDTRYALRVLRRSRGFSVITILTLALGIGATSAIFSVIDGVLLRPSPFADLDRLTLVWQTDRNTGTTREPSSVPDYLDYREHAKGFAQLAAFAPLEATLNTQDGNASRLVGLAVTHEMLPTLGVQPLAGRTLTRDDDRPGGANVVIIGERFWESQFGRDPSIIGQSIRLDDVMHTVVGVTRSTTDFGTLQILGAAAYQRAFADRGGRPRVDVWLPLKPDPEKTPRRRHHIFVVGRLNAHASAAAAQQEMTRIAGDLESRYQENAGRGVFVEPMGQVIFGRVRPALYVLMGAVALVLLVACANVANLLLARGITRTREIALRTAIGAGRLRLAGQFFVEGTTLTLLGGLLGLAMASLGLDVLLALAMASLGLDVLLALAPGDIPRVTEIGLDRRVLFATLTISAVVGMGFGMLPLAQAWRVDAQRALKGEAGYNGSAARGHKRLRALLVVAELALALVLMVGAGLLINSLWRLQGIDPGFQAERVLKAEYQLPESRYPRNSPNLSGGRHSDSISSCCSAWPRCPACSPWRLLGIIRSTRASPTRSPWRGAKRRRGTGRRFPCAA